MLKEQNMTNITEESRNRTLSELGLTQFGLKKVAEHGKNK